MKQHRQIAGFNVVVECDEEHAEQAAGLLGKIAELDKHGPPVRDGTTIRFGWSLLTLCKVGSDLVVHEPGYWTDDPDADLNPVLDDTLSVLKEQVALLHHLGVDPMGVTYRSKVVVAKGALQAAQVYMIRQKPTSADDSGWYIADVEDADRPKTEADLESLRVYKLLMRPKLMSALTLPTGYIAVFIGSVLERVSDPQNKEVFTID